MSDEIREEVLTLLRAAVESMRGGMNPSLIPEVGTNIGYALPGARETREIAAVSGRIVRLEGTVHPVGEIAFGASDHIARIILTTMKFDPAVRSAANIRYSPAILQIIEDLFLEICSFDRAKEPPGIRTMDWGVAFCCRTGVPDVIFDRGAVGKEPMIRLLGETPGEVANNIIKVSGRITKEQVED